MTGSAASAYSSSPARQAARRPGRSSTSTGSAPVGGQIIVSNSGAGTFRVSSPLTWQTHGSPTPPAAGRLRTRTERRSGSSPAPTCTWRRTAPCSASTSGASTSSCSRCGNPACRPAARASSANAATGSTGTPPTVCSAIQGRSAGDSRPVNSTSRVPAVSTTAPSRAWPEESRPAEETSSVAVPSSQ